MYSLGLHSERPKLLIKISKSEMDCGVSAVGYPNESLRGDSSDGHPEIKIEMDVAMDSNWDTLPRPTGEGRKLT